ALERDEDGYPPVSAESVWAVPTGQPFEYRLDNVPFFARQATDHDVVLAKMEDGVLWFDRMVTPSGNSLLRVVFFRPDKVQEVREALKHLGCSTEWDGAHNLVSVSVPPDVKLEAVQAFLADRASAGHIDYEEAILRQ